MKRAEQSGRQRPPEARARLFNHTAGYVSAVRRRAGQQARRAEPRARPLPVPAFVPASSPLPRCQLLLAGSASDNEGGSARKAGNSIKVKCVIVWRRRRAAGEQMEQMESQSSVKDGKKRGHRGGTCGGQLVAVSSCATSLSDGMITCAN